MLSYYNDFFPAKYDFCVESVWIVIPNRWWCT